MSTYETQEWESFELPGSELEYEDRQSFEWESQEWESEAEETELVTELLEVTSEQELEQFLGKLFRKAARAVGGVIKSPVGHALGDALKGVAKNALPMVGGAIDTVVAPGGPGTMIGSALGTMAGKMFELELERMDEQEAEFEVARRFVKLAGTAARHAARAPRSAPPRAVARAALTASAKRNAPGLLRGGAGGRKDGPGRRPPGGRPGARRGPAAYGRSPYDGPEPGGMDAGEPDDPDTVLADRTAGTGRNRRSGNRLVGELTYGPPSAGLPAYGPSGTESAMIRAAIRIGETNENALADLVFFRRHPERNGRLISRDEPNSAQLSSEWLTIRDTLVRPLLRGAPAGGSGGAPSAPGSSSGVGTFDGKPVANWFIPYLNWARQHGWQGRLNSGWRSPEYSEQLCFGICQKPTCPGRCAGRSSSHSQDVKPKGAIDVSDYVRFGELMARCPLSPRILNDLPNDRVHFSVTGH